MTRVILFCAVLLAAFIADGPVMQAYQTAPDWIASAGQAITWIGQSDWMAWVLMVAALITSFWAAQSPWGHRREEARLALRTAVVIFLILLFSGLVVQIFKHLIGRARPVHFEAFGAYAFDPLAFSFTWNSFPSGHSTTIGAVAALGTWFFPRWRGAWIALALAVGLSRIATGKHYPSDVVAGLALGGVFAVWMVKRLVKRGALPPQSDPRWAAMWRWVGSARPSLQWRPKEPEFRERLTLSLGLVFAALLFFLAFPNLDLTVAGWFHDPELGFYLNESGSLKVLREAFLLGMQILVLGSLALWALGQRAVGTPVVAPHIWAFVVAAFAMGPGLLANGIFKEFWGRARPADVDVFGGSATFTAPFERVQECASNCSFVSGEGSGLSMVLFVALALLGPQLWSRRWSVLAPTMGILGFGIALRIVKGRHFLSDTVFAILLMAIVALFLYHLLDIQKHRKSLSLHALEQDLRRSGAYLMGGLLEERSLLEDVLRVCRGVMRAFAELGRVTVGRPLR